MFVCLAASVPSDTLASNAIKVIHAEPFLANVNFTEPKVFYVRNNLDVSLYYDFNRSLNFHVKLFACFSILRGKVSVHHSYVLIM